MSAIVCDEMYHINHPLNIHLQKLCIFLKYQLDKFNYNQISYLMVTQICFTTFFDREYACIKNCKCKHACVKKNTYFDISRSNCTIIIQTMNIKIPIKLYKFIIQSKQQLFLL